MMQATEVDIERYAAGLGIELYTEYKAPQAAKLLRIGINRFREAKNAGEIPYIATGCEYAVFLGIDLVQWKLSKHTKSVSTTSPKTDKVIGAELGTTQAPSSASQQAFAQAILKKQSVN
jgi:hypothetical protein